MKYKKLAILFIVIFAVSLLAYVPKAQAICFGDCEDEEVVSFIDFEGGLNAPSAEGLDPSLTRARTAREFIINTVNFVLTFLGVIAMVIIIYGGFLYVTAAGNEEQSNKGKKAITYAVIGILIIIGSFALVNTLLTFGGGSGSDRGAGAGGGGRGSAEEGSNLGQQTVYNMGGVEVNASMNNFMAAYKNLVSINSFLAQVQAVPRPSRQQNRNYTVEVSSLIEQIKNNTNPLSRTHVASRRLLEQWNAFVSSIDLNSDDYDQGEIQDRFREKLNTPCPAEIEPGNTAGASAGACISSATIADFNAVIDDIVGPQNEPQDPQNPKGKLNIVRKVLGSIANVPAGQRGQEALQRGIINQQDMERAFAGLDPNLTVADLFDQAIAAVNSARSLASNPDRTNLVQEVQQKLYRLYIVVKDVKFVFVRIRASEREGNAPLIVELNGLESRDPSAQTIPDSNYKWDPDGDGQDGLSSGGSGFAPVECNRTEGPTITCTYKQPGTYQARLAVASSDSTHVASGQAFLPIRVSPSIGRIQLAASVGPSMREDLRRYERNSSGQWNMTIDKTEYQTTTNEATRQGVTFDASASTGGAGEPLKMFKWTFGDGSITEEGPNKTRISNHRYRREGRFPLTLEVTDRGNRRDRKIVNVVIGSLAARVQTNATIGEPETILEFDGSLSRSDSGTINSYNWSVLDTEGRNILNSVNDITIVGNTTGSTLRIKFKRPGSYTVRLEVSNGNQTAQTEIPISIRSRRPRANFTMRLCPDDCVDRSQPAVVEFDANSSFDPDQGDTLTYDWSFFNQQGDRLEAGSTMTVLNNAQLSGTQARVIRVKFPSIGRFRALLRVNDSHRDQNIRQEDTREREFNIASTVEASWTQSPSVARLESGRASLTFNGTARNASRLNINFGDGQTSEQNIENSTSSYTFNFQHDYTEAGSFFVSLRAISDQNGETTITKRVTVAAGDMPTAVIDPSVENSPVVLPEPTSGSTTPALEIMRNRVIRFSGSNSLNSAGKTSGLRYSWDFGDNVRTTGANVQHSYEELSPEDNPFIVTLTVTEEADPTKTGQATFRVRVISARPQVNTLAMEKITSGDVTPIDVRLTAEGARDPDGRITNYQFWYYEPTNREIKRGVSDTQSNQATLTVETSGAQNEEHTYYFCVTVTDNENTSSNCTDLFDENELPNLRVRNGANQAPNAAFTVDRTNVRINETVTFTSSSNDPDGRITQYVWDFDGDGFQNDNPTTLATATHTYTRRSPQGGYRTKLKVIDDRNAAGYSREIPIFVSTNSAPPVANFTYQVQTNPLRRVRFFDSSTADIAHGARITGWKWDFDTSAEIGCNVEPRPTTCNGNPADDIDSSEQNPTFDYPASGTYQIKLIAVDSNGTESEPRTVIITLTPGAAGGSGTSSPVSDVLNAELRTDPVSRFETIAGQQRKVIHVPAASNGENVTLFWGDSTGDVVSYVIDKNIWCNSDGDTNSANDRDHVHPDSINPNSGRCQVSSTGAFAENCWTTNYQRYSRTRHPLGTGRFNTLLTITDRNGNVDTDNIEVIFDGTTDRSQMQQDGCEYRPQTLGGSLFKKLGMQNTILLGLVAGVMLVLGGFGVANLLRRGKRREI